MFIDWNPHFLNESWKSSTWLSSRAAYLTNMYFRWIQVDSSPPGV
jgi:hypothetical protein